MYDDKDPSQSNARAPKKRDDTASRENREVRLAVSAIAAAISSQTLMLARYRALAGYSFVAERSTLVEGCRGIAATTEQLRGRVAALRATLPERLRSHSRLVDLDKALAALEAGVDDILEKVAG